MPDTDAEPNDELKVSTAEPKPTLTFYDAGEEEVGQLSWEDGEIDFEGDATTSAEILFEELSDAVAEEIIPELPAEYDPVEAVKALPDVLDAAQELIDDAAPKTQEGQPDIRTPPSRERVDALRDALQAARD